MLTSTIHVTEFNNASRIKWGDLLNSESSIFNFSCGMGKQCPEVYTFILMDSLNLGNNECSLRLQVTVQCCKSQLYVMSCSVMPLVAV